MYSDTFSVGTALVLVVLPDAYKPNGRQAHLFPSECSVIWRMWVWTIVWIWSALPNGIVTQWSVVAYLFSAFILMPDVISHFAVMVDTRLFRNLVCKDWPKEGRDCMMMMTLTCELGLRGRMALDGFSGAFAIDNQSYDKWDGMLCCEYNVTFIDREKFLWVKIDKCLLVDAVEWMLLFMGISCFFEVY